MLQLRPTFSESWYRVANLKVRLRPTAQISRQYYRGERWYVVRDPAGNQYHRLSDPAYRFCALLDGTRTINEAWELVGGMMDDEAPTQPEVIQILSQLYAANLIEADVTPDSSVLLKRHRNLMKRKFQQRLMNTLFPRIPIWDPDLFLQKWMPVVRGVMSWWGAAVWVLVVTLALVKIAPLHAELWAAAKNSIAPGNWFWLFLVFVVTKFIHEMGHAASTRRFGGECHEMGLMLLVFIPTPYVDASSAWSFPNRWQRIFVGAAGMVVELFVAALCAFMWAATLNNGEPVYKLINQLMYNAMLIASVSTVIFNANPLLRYDGYYMLSDYLEIPNLQKRSSDYFMGLIKRHLFRVKAREPLPNLLTRFWLFTYSITSSVYRIFVGVLIIFLVAYQVPILGVLMSIGGLITWIGMPVFKSLKYLLVEPELHRKRGRAWAWTLAGVTAGALLLGVMPFPLRVRAEGVVEPVRRQAVFTGTDGFVEQVAVQDGQRVKAGDVLMVLSDDRLQSRLDSTRALLASARYKLRLSRATDPAQAAVDEKLVEGYEQELAGLEEQAKQMVIRSAIDGEVVGPQLHELPGRWVQRGQQLMLVLSEKELVVRSLVTQGEGELIPADAAEAAGRTEVRAAGAALKVLQASSVELVPAASDKLPHPLLSYAGGGELQADPSDPNGQKAMTKQFELRAYLPPEANLLPGQRAYVRVTAEPRSIGWQVIRRCRQLIQTQSVASSAAGKS